MALTDGIVGCWSPSLGASGYRLLDRSRYSNHGVLTNMDAGTDWVGSAKGLSLDYDGVNDHAALGTWDRYNATTWACSTWIKAAATAAGQKSILAQINSTGNLGRAVRRNANQIEYTIAGTGSAFAQYKSGTTITTDWTHVAVSVSGVGTPRIWINGAESTVTLTASSGTVVIPAAQPCMIGVDGQFGTTTTLYNFAGLIGETIMFNRLLTYPEAAELYRRGNGAIGRELTGQTRRRTYGFVAGFKSYLAQKSVIIGSGVY